MRKNHPFPSQAIKALEARVEDEVLLAADGHPRTRHQIVDAVAAHPTFRDMPRPTFADDAAAAQKRGPRAGGRVYDCSYSATKVGWAPTFESIDAFFARDAEAPAEVADRR